MNPAGQPNERLRLVAGHWGMADQTLKRRQAASMTHQQLIVLAWSASTLLLACAFVYVALS